MATTARLRPALAAGALALAASLPIGRLFTGGVLIEALIAIAGALGIASLSRRYRLAPFVDLLVTLVGLAGLLSLAYLRSTLALGIIPTAGTLRGFSEMISTGISRIQNEVAPIERGPEVLIFVTIGAWLTAWLIDTAARTLTNPMLAIVAGIPMLALPGTLLVSDKLWLSVGPYVAASLFVLWSCEHPERRPLGISFRRVATNGLAAAVIAVLVVPVLPGFAERPLLKELNDSAIVFNPISALRPTLNDRKVRQLFTVRSSQPGYYRLTTLDEFDGIAFRQSTDSRRVRAEVSFAPLQPFEPTRVGVEVVTQEVQLTLLAGNWMPVQAEVSSVVADRSVSARYEPDSGALVVLPSLPRRMAYRAVSSAPRPTTRMLDRLPQTGVISLDDGDRYLALPEVSSTLRDLSRDIVGDASTPYRRAVAIQRHLRTFTYDLDVAAVHDIGSLEEFLTVVKSGYCEQFATSMAVLARIEGIPSRVVIGFGPGQVRTTVGPGAEYTVTTLDAHAWPELWLEGAGWVAFEPTPRGGFGIIPPYTLGATTSGSVDGPDPTDEPTATPSTRPTATPTTVPSRDPSTVGGSTRSDQFVALALKVLGGAAGAGMLFVAGFLLWKRLLRTPLGGLPAGYRIFLAACERVGLGRRRAETVREHALRLAKLPGIDADPIRGLASATEGVLYGPLGDTPIELLREGQAARDAVLVVVPAHRRLLAKVRANVGAVTGV